MSLPITSIDDISEEKFATVLNTMTGLIQEKYPNIDLRRGVFHDLVLYFSSVLNAGVQENIDRILAGSSLLKLEENPELATPAVVDQLLSNYNLQRNTGSFARGLVSLVLPTAETTQFVAGTTIVANNINFVLPETYVVVASSAAATTNNHRVMQPLPDGTYTAALTFVATTTGTAGNIAAGTVFTAPTALDNVINISAASDFIGGKEADTNTEYLQKLKSGLAAKTVGGRASYEAFLRAQPGLENILHVSVAGAGDAEQHRYQHSIIPISGGGRVYVYVQTAPAAQTIQHSVVATFIGDSAAGTLWQINIDRDLAPGYYNFTGVISETGDSTTNVYEIKNDYRVMNLYGLNFTPDIENYVEGVYSRYQAGYVVFEDVDTLSSGLTPYVSTQNYRLLSSSMPLIREIDAVLTARNNRPRGTDILVKAAVPCFTKINIDISTDDFNEISDYTITAMKTAVVRAVQNVGFSGQLYASLISSEVSKLLNTQQAVNRVDMFGRIRRPDGEMRHLRDQAVLRIPYDPEHMVTSKTTVFLTAPSDVEIAVTNNYTS